MVTKSTFEKYYQEYHDLNSKKDKTVEDKEKLSDMELKMDELEYFAGGEFREFLVNLRHPE